MGRGRILDISLAIFLISILVLCRVLEIHLDGGLYFKEKCIGSTCVFLRLTDTKCPFCGISRSMVALMHGQFSDSISFHPLGLLFTVLFIVYVISVFISFYNCKEPIIERKIFTKICISIMICSVILWIFNGKILYYLLTYVKNYGF